MFTPINTLVAFEFVEPVLPVSRETGRTKKSGSYDTTHENDHYASIYEVCCATVRCKDM